MHSNRKFGDLSRIVTAHPNHISHVNSIIINCRNWPDTYSERLTNDEMEPLPVSVLLVCPWDRLVDQLLLLPELVRVRVQCRARDVLVRLIQEYQASLAKLGDRLELVYRTSEISHDSEPNRWPYQGLVALDIDTLEDTGRVVYREYFDSYW